MNTLTLCKNCGEVYAEPVTSCACGSQNVERVAEPEVTQTPTPKALASVTGSVEWEPEAHKPPSYMSVLLAAADPFIRVVAIIDSLPPGHLPSDETPLRDVLPGVWPTLGELRAFVKAANADSSQPAPTI